MVNYIMRRLEVTERDGHITKYSDTDFFNIAAPLVVIGEPGAGKTELMEQLAKNTGVKRWKASEVIGLPAALPHTDDRTIIDGLDEVKALQAGAPIIHLMAKLTNDVIPNFILTCRAADWQHALNQQIISDRSLHQPVLGRLMPFNDDEIVAFINANSDENGVAFLNQAKEKDILDFLRNPQNLLMLLEVVRTSGWPTTRSELFDKACRVFVKEENTIIKSAALNRPPSEKLLSAAGFIYAQLLLSGAEGVYIDY